MKLLTIEEIIKNKKPAPDLLEYAGIYFLINKTKVVYIGQTVSGFAERILCHIKRKKIKFDSYSVIPILLISKNGVSFIEESNFFSPNENSIPHLEFKKRLNQLEANYIFKLMPKYNYMIPKQEKYMTKNHLKDNFKNIPWQKIREGIKKQKIIPILKYDTLYFKIFEIEKYLKHPLVKRGSNIEENNCLS